MSGLDDGLLVGLFERGLSRRTFLKFCATMTAVLALPPAFAPRVAAAVSAAPRMPVIWLRGQGCGGETEALLQAANPSTATLLLDLLSIDYQDALMASSGDAAVASRAATMRQYPNGYFALIEGAVPTADDGVYLTIGGRSFADVAREVTAGAVATIALGACAFDGGLVGASGGTTGSTGVNQAVSKSPLINLPGCPVNVDNLTATIVHYLTFKEMPATDLRGRPLFAYGALVHNECERRPHFEFGEFVQAWGDEGAQKGWCLYKMGCKGPETFANCASVRFGQGTSWPVEAGAVCIGCTMPGFWDTMSPFSTRLPPPLPFAPDVTADQVGLAAVAGVGGLAVAPGAAGTAPAAAAAAVAAAVAPVGAAALDQPGPVAAPPIEPAAAGPAEVEAAEVAPEATPDAGDATSQTRLSAAPPASPGPPSSALDGEPADAPIAPDASPVEQSTAAAPSDEAE
jgi:hydrogenase small subunit